MELSKMSTHDLELEIVKCRFSERGLDLIHALAERCEGAETKLAQLKMVYEKHKGLDAFTSDPKYNSDPAAIVRFECW